jgi:hypothetical protein
MILNVNEQLRAKSKLSPGFGSGTLGMQKWGKTALISCKCAQNKMLMHKRLNQQANRRSLTRLSPVWNVNYFRVINIYQVFYLVLIFVGHNLI